MFFFHQLAAKRRKRLPNYRRHLLRRRHLRRRGDHLREQRGVRAPPHDDDDDDYEDSSYSLSLNARVYIDYYYYSCGKIYLLTKVLLVSALLLCSSPNALSLRSVSLTQLSGLDKVFCLKKVYLKSKEEKHARTPSHCVLLSL